MNELPEVLEELEDKKGPFKIIGAILLILLLVLFIVPNYAFKVDPNPVFIPEYEKVIENAPDNSVYHLDVVGSYDISPFMKHVSSQIVKGCSDISEVCYAKAVYYFVVENVEYVPDPEREYIQSAEETILNRAGDCEDMTIVLGQTMKTLGIESRVVLTHNHAFLEVLLPEAKKGYKYDSDWVALDATSGGNFGEVNPQLREKIINYVYLW